MDFPRRKNWKEQRTSGSAVPDVGPRTSAGKTPAAPARSEARAHRVVNCSPVRSSETIAWSLLAEDDHAAPTAGRFQPRPATYAVISANTRVNTQLKSFEKLFSRSVLLPPFALRGLCAFRLLPRTPCYTAALERSRRVRMSQSVSHGGYACSVNQSRFFLLSSSDTGDVQPVLGSLFPLLRCIVLFIVGLTGEKMNLAQ